MSRDGSRYSTTAFIMWTWLRDFCMYPHTRGQDSRHGYGVNYLRSFRSGHFYHIRHFAKGFFWVFILKGFIIIRMKQPMSFWKDNKGRQLVFCHFCQSTKSTNETHNQASRQPHKLSSFRSLLNITKEGPQLLVIQPFIWVYFEL